jgi:integrase
MAMIEKRGKSFRIIFRHGGIRYTRSLATKDDRAAHSALVRLEDKLHRLEIGTLTAPAGVDLVDFLLSDGRLPEKVNVFKIERKAVTFTALFADYFARLPEGNLEENTIKTMKLHVNLLEKHFEKSYMIDGLTLTELQGYVEKRSKDPGRNGRKVTPVTIKKAIITLRTVWNWGRQHGLITKPFPSKGLRYPKGNEKPPFMTFAEVEKRAATASDAEKADLWECVFLSLREIEGLLECVKENARHEFLYPMFVFAAHTGARRSEMIRSKLTDLDFDRNLITIHERKKSHDKRTTRQVPMSEKLRVTLREWVQKHPGGIHTFTPGTHVFRSKKDRSHCIPLTSHEAHHYFRNIFAGTKWDQLHGWHVFRHSFCSNCAAKGLDQRIINAWVGHMSDDMVRRYRHLLPDQNQSAITSVFGGASQTLISSS